MKHAWLHAIPEHLGWYLSGFTDGEGSFNVSVRKTPDRTHGWRLEPMFNVSQKDRTILALMKRHLDCGTLRERPDGIVYYEVQSLRSLNERVIPFFEKFRFHSGRKIRNFSIFRSIVRKMIAQEHLTPEGFRSILALRHSLNEGRGRKRKYDTSNIELHPQQS